MKRTIKKDPVRGLARSIKVLKEAVVDLQDQNEARFRDMVEEKVRRNKDDDNLHTKIKEEAQRRRELGEEVESLGISKYLLWGAVAVAFVTIVVMIHTLIGIKARVETLENNQDTTVYSCLG